MVRLFLCALSGSQSKRTGRLPYKSNFDSLPGKAGGLPIRLLLAHRMLPPPRHRPPSLPARCPDPPASSHQQNDPRVHPGQMGRSPQRESSQSRIAGGAGNAVAFAYDTCTTTKINKVVLGGTLTGAQASRLCKAHGAMVPKWPSCERTPVSARPGRPCPHLSLGYAESIRRPACATKKPSPTPTPPTPRR